MRKSLSVWVRGTSTLAGVVVAASSILFAVSARASFVTFETGQVRPLALAPDGNTLYAINTPDNRLEIFDVDGNGDLSHAGAIPVGLEPIAVAVRPDGTQVWVVNHLSDSVSIIDLTGATPRVVRTLLVGDEPRDIVFADGGTRAFITTARRGQNVPLTGPLATPPLLTTAGTPRALVWAFDVDNLGSTLEGTPLAIIPLFTDTPRALAVSPDGTTVYAAGFHTGNQTTAISEGVVCNDGNLNNNLVPGACTIIGVSYPGGMPLPERSADNVPRPETGLVVRFNQGAGQWQDQLSRNWNNAVRFNLPDRDVFVIDADANPVPIAVAGPSGFFAGVGTVLFNMVANPNTGVVYVSNTEARNEVRFEGPGIIGGSTVRGHLQEARITVLSGGSVVPRHLNSHLNYAVVPSPPGVEDDSLATPVEMVVTSDGNTLYVAAFGSGKIGVYDTGQLELGTFTPALVPHITVSGGGPSGLVLNETKNRLYALTRFDNAVSVINTTSNLEIAHLPVFNPEPAPVVNGRPFLYDALVTSSNGEAACAACHIFGDLDSLGWDLGNPDDVVLNNPNPIKVSGPVPVDFHPMKGPMTTQSLRGMANHGPMHWRGDRTGGNDAPNIPPNSGSFDEDAAFKKFNVAFEGLLGREGPLTAGQMQAFTDFILEVTYPPNPIRNLDDVLVGDALAGRNFYFAASPSDNVFNCNGCHVLNRAQGFFGGDGEMTFENEPQFVKIPHLRNLYQKVGMFGMPAVSFFNSGNNGSQGDQIRGFGFLHDGSTDTLFRFHQATVFNQSIFNPGGFTSDTQRRQVEAFMLAFDSNLAPIVGQQVTLTSTNGLTVDGRIDLLIAQAGSDYFPGTRHCDLVVKGSIDGEARGWLYVPGSSAFRSDRSAEPLITDANLRALASTTEQELTYTCVPPGSGQRIGIDRDDDGIFDGDEATCSPTLLAGCKAPGKGFLLMKPNAGREKLTWKWQKGAQTDDNELGDPVGGSTSYQLCIYTGTANDVVFAADIGAQGTCGVDPCWKPIGSGRKYKDATLSVHGTQQILLKAGAMGKAKASWKGKGSNLLLPTLPPQGLSLPVTVQLSNSDGTCWEAEYDANDIKDNDATQFKAKF